jgi:hypothetical protein
MQLFVASRDAVVTSAPRNASQLCPRSILPTYSGLSEPAEAHGDIRCVLCCPALDVMVHDILLEVDIARVGVLVDCHWTRGLKTHNGHLVAHLWTLHPYVSSLYSTCNTCPCDHNILHM